MKCASVFSDHMVIPRDRPVPVWGWAAAGTAVRVSFRGAAAEAVADGEGYWRCGLPPMAASAVPSELRVECGDAVVLFQDILTGDVWLCSGQSNMAFTLKESSEAKAALAAAMIPGIRLLKIENEAIPEGREAFQARWQVSNAATAAVFSAVGWYFGQRVHAETGVPLGLIHCAWGGTYIEAWIDREGLCSLDFMRERVETYEHNLPFYRERHAHYLQGIRRAEEQASPLREALGAERQYAEATCPDAEWASMEIPCAWTKCGHAYSGVFWFRKEVDLPPDWQGKTLVLMPGACDKADITFFNGREIGRMGGPEQIDAWCNPREYRIDGDGVRAGRNVIAVRVWSHMYDGGLIGPAEAMKLYPEGEPEKALPLTGAWRYKVVHSFGNTDVPAGPGVPNSPYILFNTMIRPLVPFPVSGVLWYQGESNASRYPEYEALMRVLISSWRRVFGEPRLPFYYVQLANFNQRSSQPRHTDWSGLREAQRRVLAVPHTGMATAVDVGEALDIHPRDKKTVGLRLAALALEDVCGPLFERMETCGPEATLFFSHTGGGLVWRGRAGGGFAVAGRDGVFHWAEARIEGDTVVVCAPVVPEVGEVRYAWDDDPECTLYNREGFPAPPFTSETCLPTRG